MEWLTEFFKEYQFQLWLVGITSMDQLMEIIRNKNNIAELIIALNPRYAYWYALHIIEGPWSPGKKAIALDPWYAYKYARHIIKGPWPMGEKAIASDPEYAYWYARNIIDGPWPPGEKVIASDPYWKKEYETHFKVKI